MSDTREGLERVIETLVAYPNGEILPETLVLVTVSEVLYPELVGVMYADRAGNLYRSTARNGTRPPTCTPYTAERIYAWEAPAMDETDREPTDSCETFFELTHRSKIAEAAEIARRDCEVGYD